MASNGPLPPLPREFPDSPCYVCCMCNTVVGWAQHLLLNDVLAIIPDVFLLSDIQTANVFVENRPFERGVYRLFTLYCRHCFNLIGWKIVSSGGPLSTIFAEGRYIFFARHILFWDTLTLEDPVWDPSDIR